MVTRLLSRVCQAARRLAQTLGRHPRRAEALGSGCFQVKRPVLLPVAVPPLIEQQRA